MDEGDPGTHRSSMQREVTFWLAASLVVAAVLFYLWWGFSFGVWADNGEYAVFITMVGFGLAGMWLATPDPPAAPLTVPKG